MRIAKQLKAFSESAFNVQLTLERKLRSVNAVAPVNPHE